MKILLTLPPVKLSQNRNSPGNELSQCCIQVVTTFELVIKTSCNKDLVGAGASCLLLGPPGSNWCFSFASGLVGYSAPRDLHRRAAYSICESWFLIHQDVYHDLFVCS